MSLEIPRRPKPEKVDNRLPAPKHGCLRRYLVAFLIGAAENGTFRFLQPSNQ